jgi:hypothetical protein
MITPAEIASSTQPMAFSVPTLRRDGDRSKTCRWWRSIARLIAASPAQAAAIDSSVAVMT